MFEGKPPNPRDAQPDGADTAASDDLRPLTWSDLRMRLEAARDMRSAVSSEEEDRLASFDAYSASRIAARADGKEGINPDDLANGKEGGLNSGVTSADDGDFGSDPGN